MSASETSGGAGSKTLQVLEALKQVVDPARGENVVALGRVKNLSIKENEVSFDLLMPPDNAIDEDALDEQLDGIFRGIPWVTGVQFGLVRGEATPAPPPQAPPQKKHEPTISEQSMPEIKHVIAVGSGKGGVGKSTVSVNLALALAQQGHKVGLMDADVYGPSVPLMLGLEGNPTVNADQKLEPLEKHGMKVMSMGFLLKPDQAVVWRGPMIHGVIRQFLSDVEWGELDYLIVDLPPGTGDAPLSLTQALPLTASVVVTTPQEVAASVAQKAMSMFERMGINTLGIIENMSYFICPHCEEMSDIFDRGGGRRLAEEHGIAFLGEIPIDIRMRKGGDVGEPVVVQFPDSELAQKFNEVAKSLAEQVG
jgi:ATP-binding protein involved in chromosome partitioning